MDIGKNILKEGGTIICVFVGFLGSEQYEGNYMFSLLVEEGGEKSWPDVPRELLNENMCLDFAAGVVLRVSSSMCTLEAASVSSGQCYSYYLCPW